MSRYLVTGGCGFIGSHLVEQLLRLGHNVCVLDDLSTGARENIPANVPLIIGSVSDPAIVETAMRGVDGCFHLAAVASVDRSREAWLETHRINLSGTIAVFDVARQEGGVAVVYASSAAVYGDNPNSPYAEDAATRPLSAYGADKLACELHAKVAGWVHKLPTIGFRIFNAYGPRQDPLSPYSGVVSIFAERISRQRPVVIYGDGEQVRDFVYVDDVVRFLIAGMHKVTTEGAVYNLCSGKPTSVTMLVTMISDLAGATPEIIYRPTRVGDIRTSIGSPSLSFDAVGVRCETPLADGLRQAFRWIGGRQS